jgi:hypothetical protein
MSRHASVRGGSLRQDFGSNVAFDRMVAMFTGMVGLRYKTLATLGGALLAAVLLAAYANHFYNSFHFDDAHTIVNNAAIRDLRNITVFFHDAATFSSLPSNQSYRPLVSTLLAIDYRLGGLKPFWFHVSIFALFVTLTVLLAFVIQRLLTNTAPEPAAGWIAVAAAAWYGVHPANADTINYVISVSEVISTLGVVASFAVYLSFPNLRRYYVYVLPSAIAILAKPPAAIFAVLFAIYRSLFPSHGARLPGGAARACRGDYRAIRDLRGDVTFCEAYDAAHVGCWRSERAQLPDHAAVRRVALFQDFFLAQGSFGRLRP